KGWFGPDDVETEGEDMGAESHVPARRPHSSPSFYPLSSSNRQFRVSVRLNATTMEDAQDAVDSLKDRNQVIINLENANADEGMDRRILDFVSGACYSLDGFYQRVGAKVFLFAPSNISIEVEDEPQRGGIKPPSFLSQV
nr:cell division protein SepF [Armatimonadota bacterium]